MGSPFTLRPAVAAPSWPRPPDHPLHSRLSKEGVWAAEWSAVSLPPSCQRKARPILEDLTLLHKNDAGGHKEGCPRSLRSDISLSGSPHVWREPLGPSISPLQLPGVLSRTPLGPCSFLLASGLGETSSQGQSAQRKSGLKRLFPRRPEAEGGSEPSPVPLPRHPSPLSWRSRLLPSPPRASRPAPG